MEIVRDWALIVAMLRLILSSFRSKQIYPFFFGRKKGWINLWSLTVLFSEERMGLLFLNILVYIIYELMGVNVHLYNLLLRFSPLDPDTDRGCKDSWDLILLHFIFDVEGVNVLESFPDFSLWSCYQLSPLSFPIPLKYLIHTSDVISWLVNTLSKVL